MSITKYIFSNANRAFVYSLLVIWIILILYVTTRMGYLFGIAASLTPILLFLIVMIVQNPYWCYFALFVANYYLSGFGRYFETLQPGIIMDIIIAITIVSTMVSSFQIKSEIKFRNALNGLTIGALLWFIYCFLELMNPNSSSAVAWLTSVRGIGVYFFVVVSLTAIIMRKYKDLKRFLFIWAILSLTAVLKAFIQKTFGFDSGELYWLYVGGGSVTHIIYSGIRYFSFFSDAGNFGTGIAFSGVVFAISSLYFKGIGMKIFYLFTAAACIYGMLISGTRGALAVPFVAFTVFVLLSKNLRYITLTTILIIFGYIFLNYTSIGQGNSYIRRMRTAFNPDDASLQVRLDNQQKLRAYLSDKPFGAGIGMSRGKASTYRPDAFLSKIPSDSWYVLIWVENGIIGLILHMLILLYIIFHGAYLVLIRLKNPQLKGLITALICGISGVYVASYSIEIIGQFPMGIILYVCMAFVFLSPVFEKELEEAELSNPDIYEKLI